MKMNLGNLSRVCGALAFCGLASGCPDSDHSLGTTLDQNDGAVGTGGDAGLLEAPPASGGAGGATSAGGLVGTGGIWTSGGNTGGMSGAAGAGGSGGTAACPAGQTLCQACGTEVCWDGEVCPVVKCAGPDAGSAGGASGNGGTAGMGGTTQTGGTTTGAGGSGGTTACPASQTLCDDCGSKYCAEVCIITNCMVVPDAASEGGASGTGGTTGTANCTATDGGTPPAVDQVTALKFSTVTSIPSNPPPSVHVIVADAAKAQDAYQATLALPAAPQGVVRSCPLELGVTYQIALFLANGSRLMATADPNGCSYVDISGTCTRSTDPAYWSQLAQDLGIPVSEIYPYPPQGTAPVSVAIAPGLTSYSPIVQSVPGLPMNPVASGSLPANPLYRWRTDYGTFALWNHPDGTVAGQGSDFTVGDRTVYLQYLTAPLDMNVPVWIHLDLIDGSSAQVLASGELSLVWSYPATLTVQ